ncbi:hypothetical protein CQA53_05855 [Helicobacter didelphidarum]|uniref:Lipoprotein LPP20-like domain-containing protein n=1 Tax=Helicobacter didelphidarum TaxID=2040648 RepID=A0A3D8ILM4_9HELI|nr:LPP20 family lipoprotein [Helicobacter didelphidarum]RDU65816.1 hypothetical protein CQA53_05855 [Helicobacter didelphidarum]
MKTDVLKTAGKFVSVGVLAAFLVACGGDKAQPLTSNKDEPAWVNNMKAAKEAANSLIAAVGQAKLLDGNINYATNQATMQARIQIAQSVSAGVEQAIKDMAQSDGLKISENSLQAAKQKVEATLQKTEMVQRWVDKSTNPQTLYVLVSMDKEAYENAMKNTSQVLNIDADKAKKLSDTVEEMLKK